MEKAFASINKFAIADLILFLCSAALANVKLFVNTCSSDRPSIILQTPEKLAEIALFAKSLKLINVVSC